MQAISITELVAARIAAKRREDEAVQARREIDNQLAELLADPHKVEGSISQKADGFKLTVTYGVTRKVDTDKLSADWSKLSIDVQAAFKWTAGVSVSELRKIESKAAAVAAKYIESKPSSPTIKIEAV